jgi:hypothetical protein
MPIAIHVTAHAMARRKFLFIQVSLVLEMDVVVPKAQNAFRKTGVLP